MAYTKTNWTARQGTNLNKFTKSADTATSVILVNSPDSITQAGTPFSVENMNKIEQGIYDAHAGISALSDTLTAHSDMTETGRNLLDVLGVASIPAAMTALSARCNGTGTPNFRGLLIGDYIDGINLSAIPAENGGDAGQVWNSTYKNNRIVLSGFNTYKGCGDTETTKNHLLFTFRNCPLRCRMNQTDDNTGGYTASDMRAFLEGLNGDGTGAKSGVTTAAFLSALAAQLGGGRLLTIRKMHSKKGAQQWASYTVFPPSEPEVFGSAFLGDEGVYMPALTSPALPQRAMYAIAIQMPIYQKSSVYWTKRYNGGRYSWWEQTPRASSDTIFTQVSHDGITSHNYASSIGGCAPAFCVA
jgi:hypothetical protein